MESMRTLFADTAQAAWSVWSVSAGRRSPRDARATPPDLALKVYDSAFSSLFRLSQVPPVSVCDLLGLVTRDGRDADMQAAMRVLLQDSIEQLKSVLRMFLTTR